MNLYKIEFRHYSPKDSEYGIKGYIVAKDDEEVYEFIKSEPEVNDEGLYNSYQDNENDEEEFDIYDDNYNVIGTESFKDRMIRIHGEMYDDEAEVSDLYYGVTQYGWSCLIENITDQDISGLRYLGILVN